MPVRHDDYVKKPLDVFEYTPEHIKELQKCQNDFWYFLKYVKIVHPDKGRIPFEYYPYQKIVLKSILENQFHILNMGRQIGKCVQKQTLITIRNKKTGKIEEIPIGDFYDREKINRAKFKNGGYSKDKKFIEEINISDYEVLTPNGWKDFDGICKTVPYEVWRLELVDGTYLECADNHIIFKNGEKCFVSNLVIGDFVDTKNGPVPIKSIKNIGISENMFDLRNVEDHIYLTNNIISHNTTLVSVYALWYTMFNSDKIIGIVSNKQTSAVSILTRFKVMYEELPVWLKPGVVEYSKLSIEFDNGTRIIVRATSEDAFRGEPLNLLVCDEFAWVRKSIQEAFWAANYPTISQSIDAKIILISTPCGPFDLFHKIFTEAQRGLNTFIPMTYDWRAVPGRDEKWLKVQKKNLGERKFCQEHEAEFLGSIDTVIKKEVLEKLFYDIKVPIKEELNNKLKIYEFPIKDRIYVIGHDPSKGTGQNSACSQVLRLDALDPAEFTQVATFLDNKTNVYKQADILHRLSIYYNNAWILCENNGEGSPVTGRLWWDYENEGLVNDRKNKPDEVGIRATMSNKPKLVLLMKKLIEDTMLHLFDKDTIEQLATFIEKGGKLRGKDDMPDDAVSGLYWATWILKMNIISENIKLSKETEAYNEENEVWNIYTEEEIDKISKNIVFSDERLFD